MRLRFAVALISVVASVAIAACSEGGNGTGTAPPPPPACPTAVPVAATACTALQVCDYAAESKVAVCPFAGGTWEIHERGEAGVFTDAEIPEVLVDSGAEGGDADAADATDATDATDETSADAADETSADAEPDTLASDAASDGG